MPLCKDSGAPCCQLTYHLQLLLRTLLSSLSPRCTSAVAAFTTLRCPLRERCGRGAVTLTTAWGGLEAYRSLAVRRFAQCHGTCLSTTSGPAFTPHIGRMEGLREYGVGDIVSVAAGDRVTVVATIPYAPPPDYKVREIARLDLAREKQSRELYEKHHEQVRRASVGWFAQRACVHFTSNRNGCGVRNESKKKLAPGLNFSTKLAHCASSATRAMAFYRSCFARCCVRFVATIARRTRACASLTRPSTSPRRMKCDRACMFASSRCIAT